MKKISAQVISSCFHSKVPDIFSSNNMCFAVVLTAISILFMSFVFSSLLAERRENKPEKYYCGWRFISGKLILN